MMIVYFVLTHLFGVVAILLVLRNAVRRVAMDTPCFAKCHVLPSEMPCFTEQNAVYHSE